MSITLLVASAILVSVVLLLASMGIFFVIRRSKRLVWNRKRAAANAKRREFLIEDDISNGRELNRVPAISYAKHDSTPLDFHYVNEHVCVEPISVDTSLTRMNCCQCLGDCATSDCECLRPNQAGPHYDLEGRLSSNHLSDSLGAIRECNIACKCNRKECKNMVIQGGSRLNLILFKTKSRGWGVRTLDPITKGTFIGNYSGELISSESSTKREDDTYLFNLSNSIIRNPKKPIEQTNAEELTTAPEGRGKSVPAAESQMAHEDEKQRASDLNETPHAQQVEADEDCYEEAGEQQQLDSMGADQTEKLAEDQFFICDAKHYGNFTRFINHSCEPNVIGIRAFTVHQDDRFPYISFFANKDVQPGDELTLNYGDNYWLVKCRRDGVYCLCKAPTCRFTKKTFKQTLKKYNEQNNGQRANQ